jgi:hypothetical protein
MVVRIESSDVNVGDEIGGLAAFPRRAPGVTD